MALDPRNNRRRPTARGESDTSASRRSSGSSPSRRTAGVQTRRTSSAHDAQTQRTQSQDLQHGQRQRSSAASHSRMRSSQQHVSARKGNNKLIIKVVAIVAAMVLGVLLVSQLTLTFLKGGFNPVSTTAEESSSVSEAAVTYASPYVWSNLSRSGGRFEYKIGGVTRSSLGVDVSENQQDIDWNAVAEDGIDFAIVRLGYRGTTAGSINLDKYYEQNIVGATNAGLDTGVYFFSQATSVDEAREEADFVLDNLGGRSLEYPVYYDCEEVAAGAGKSRTSGMSKEEMTACAKAFCQRIEEGGYTAMIYGNGTDLSRYNLSELSNYDIWYAEYNIATPTIQHDFVMWQYSNSGTVSGISTSVDMNIDLSEVYEAAKKS